MADGTKPIQKIHVGDWVLAEDPETGERGPRQVTEFILGIGPKKLIGISLAGSSASVTATDAHPFWDVTVGAWVRAKDLKPGDELRTEAGRTVQVSQVHAESVPFQAVYNLTIEGLHTYYVLFGQQPVLVHNARCQVTQRIPDDQLRAPSRRGNAPIGSDGRPVELHHLDQSLGNASPRAEMTRTDHRGAGNYSRNHDNTGQRPSTVDRAESRAEHRDYWGEQWDSGRGGWNQNGGGN